MSESREWFGYADICSCAQHYEVKILANKLYNRWCNLIDKASDIIIRESPNINKFDAIQINIDKTERELSNILRGLMKCCAPAHHGFKNPFEAI